MHLLRSGFLALAAAFMLAGCTEIHVASHLFKKAEGSCATQGDIKVGKPYLVDGVRYEPMVSSLGYREKGIASWYGTDFHGKATANGECYNMYAFTAAHKTLPMPTVVRVTNLENNKSIVLKVNDRGPFVRGRILDLSYAAAQSLDIVRYGTAPVMVEAIGGPHHQIGGYKGGPTELAVPASRNDQVAEVLPSTTPNAVQQESLPPLVVDKEAIKAAKAETARERKLGVPAPNTNIPAPPAYEDRVFADTTPLSKTRVYIQVGAFAEEARAATQRDALAQVYRTSAITPVQAGGRTLLRVRAGPFHSVADADDALDKIVKAGFNGAQIKVED